MRKIVKDEELNYTYTARTLAELFNVSERQIHYYREHNQLECVTQGRARFIFPKESVVKFLVDKWGYEYEA
jgi:hypothetical protein